jgi:hypothetical protein
MIGMISPTMMMMEWMDGTCVTLVDFTVWRQTMVVMSLTVVSFAIVVSIVPSIFLGRYNVLIQNSSFASFGCADSLNADENTLREFVGRSSLPLVDQLTVHFLERYQWTMTPNKTDALRKQPIGCIFV